MAKTMTLRLDEERAALLELIARADGQTLTDAVRAAIDAYIEQRRNDQAFRERLAKRHEEERTLVARFGAHLRADLLKVGHHGSRTSSSPGLLAAVQPKAAAISAGVRNRFGHPHPATLETLAAHGVEVLRTDRGGAIVWETDGEVVKVSRP